MLFVVRRERMGVQKYAQLMSSAMLLLMISYEAHCLSQEQLRWKYITTANASTEATTWKPTSSLQKAKPTQRSQEDRIQKRQAPLCSGASFCEHPRNYPTALIAKALAKKPSLFRYAYADVVEAIAPRIDVDDDEPLCLAIEQVVYPKAAETMNKEWLYVINLPNFTQSVRIETCVEEDSTCRMIDGFAEGYVTACKQKYIYRQLSAITADGRITREFFRFPASCCCHVRFTGEDTLTGR